MSLVNWSQEIYHAIAMPLLRVLPSDASMIATDITSVFFVPIKVTLMVAFVITLPHSLYQAWAFIAPGLYRHEIKFALPFILSCFLLFLTGMIFSFFVVLPIMFAFIAGITPDGVLMMTDITKYLSFIITTFLTFGLAFEVPVLVTMLVLFKVMDITQLRNGRPYVIILSFVIAAIITPPDILSQALLAIPLCLLYEVGIMVATLVSRTATHE